MRLDGSVGNGGQPVPRLVDDPPARDPKAGVESDNAHDRIESQSAPRVKSGLPPDRNFRSFSGLMPDPIAKGRT